MTESKGTRLRLSTIQPCHRTPPSIEKKKKFLNSLKRPPVNSWSGGLKTSEVRRQMKLASLYYDIRVLD